METDRHIDKMPNSRSKTETLPILTGILHWKYNIIAFVNPLFTLFLRKRTEDSVVGQQRSEFCLYVLSISYKKIPITAKYLDQFLWFYMMDVL